MCGRISLASSPEDVIDEFGVPALPPDYRPRYNIAPSQPVLAIVADGEAPGVRFLRWGLIPFWARDPSIGNRMINARAETVADKPAFRNALKRRRCLIPVDGFYEWKRQAKQKVPMRIRLRSRRPFALAGLWEEWRPRHAAPIRSCTVLTTLCSEVLRPVHDRMPVILEPEARRRWLDEDTDAAALRELLVPYTGSDLEVYEVSTLVNSPANDLAECIEPV